MPTDSAAVGVRAMAGVVGGATAADGWAIPAGGGDVISRESPPLWISAPAAAAAAARSAVGAGRGAETGFDAGCAGVRRRGAGGRPVAGAEGGRGGVARAAAEGAAVGGAGGRDGVGCGGRSRLPRDPGGQRAHGDRRDRGG